MYQNAYQILGEVRRGLGEYSTGYVNGTDTTGNFDNSDIMVKINDAQRYIWNILTVRFPELFQVSVSVTAVSSVIVIPGDVHLIRRLENSNGDKIDPISINQKHSGNTAGSKYGYSRYATTMFVGAELSYVDVIKIDADDCNDTFTSWYWKRVRELDQGLSTAGGALSLTLASSARSLASYYNGMYIENVTDSWVDAINSYSSARVCTLAAQTGAASKYYGLISDLPEPFHHLIAPKALIMMKSDPKAAEKASASEKDEFTSSLAEALRSFAGTLSADKTMESVFLDFGPYY